MFQDPPSTDEFRKLVQDREGSFEKPYLLHVGPGARKNSLNFWYLSAGCLHKGTIRTTPKDGCYVIQCVNNRRTKCKYVSYLKYVGAMDNEEERCKIWNWETVANPDWKPHSLIPNESEKLPETYQKNVTRFCYFSEQFFYHHNFR